METKIIILVMTNIIRKKLAEELNVKIMNYVKQFYLNGGLNVREDTCVLLAT